MTSNIKLLSSGGLRFFPINVFMSLHILRNFIPAFSPLSSFDFPAEGELNSSSLSVKETTIGTSKATVTCFGKKNHAFVWILHHWVFSHTFSVYIN